jgi:hypothetical protein
VDALAVGVISTPPATAGFWYLSGGPNVHMFGD